jgi:hypothetical protein
VLLVSCRFVLVAMFSQRVSSGVGLRIIVLGFPVSDPSRVCSAGWEWEQVHGLNRSSARDRFTATGVLPDSPVPHPIAGFPLPTLVSRSPSSPDLGFARSRSLGAGFDFTVLRMELASPCLFAKSPEARRLAGLDLVPARVFHEFPIPISVRPDLGLCGRQI